MSAALHALLGRSGDTMKVLMAPLFIVFVLAMMVLPLPPFALDLLFTFNIALALMVMMVAAHMKRPLDFAAFPAVLLVITLLRLSLNVASTRVVLLDGHTGTGAAGRVIESEREARTDLGDALGTLRDDDEVDDDEAQREAAQMRRPRAEPGAAPPRARAVARQRSQRGGAACRVRVQTDCRPVEPTRG